MNATIMPEYNEFRNPQLPSLDSLSRFATMDWLSSGA